DDDAPELRARAGRTLVRAGERAAALAAAAEAKRYFEQAAELTGDPLEQAQLADRAGQMAWRASQPEEARALLERSRAAFEALSDAAATARVDAMLAELDFAQGHPPQAVARLAPALEALEATGTDADVATITGQLGRF